MSRQSLQEQRLESIIHGCREESHQGRDRDLGHCFELFRRALEEQDHGAWSAIEQQYRRLLLSWIYQAGAGELAQDEAEDLAREALEKFWRTLTTRSVVSTGRFQHVGALLRYLNQCAITTVIDHRRRAARRRRLIERLHAAHAGDLSAAEPEAAALEGLCRAERVQQIRRWIRDHVIDPQEQRILHLSYERDLTPAEIVAHYPAEFAEVDIVRRIKERVLKRARRAFSDEV